MDNQRVARLHQIPRHGFAHDAQTDKTDNRVGHGLSPSIRSRELQLERAVKSERKERRQVAPVDHLEV
jgi:hypothetical protein